MIILYNPTNEELTGQHGGNSITIKSKVKMEVEDPRGNHLLNSLGPRGLCVLTYVCDEKQVKADGIQRNYEFKKKQVVEYNQRNENRKAQGLPYLPPTKEVKSYGVELQLQLLEPYAIRDEERGEIADIKVRNKELQSQIVDLQIMLTKFIEGQERKEAPAKDA